MTRVFWDRKTWAGVGRHVSGCGLFLYADSSFGKVQEMLGEAIMAAAWAETYSERAWSQEVLGLLIVNETLLGLRESPIGMSGETEAVITGP